MSTATDPMPLDNLPEHPPAPAHRPLSWLRERLFRDRRSAAAEPAVAAAATTLPAPPTSSGRGQALRKAHAALQLLFASHHGLAQVFPHLSLLEKELARQGSQALRRLPSPVLQRALEQLHELELTREHPDLPVLRNRVIEELALRSVRADARRATAAAAPIVPPVPDAGSPEALDTDITWVPQAPTSRRH